VIHNTGVYTNSEPDSSQHKKIEPYQQMFFQNYLRVKAVAVCAAKNVEKTENNSYTISAHFFIMQPSDQVRTKING
jgi:hypothetical protein